MPVRLRLTIFNALVIGVILTLLGLGLLFLLRDALLSEIEQTTDARAEAAAELIRDEEALEEADSSPGTLTFDEDEEGRLTVDGVFIVVRDDAGNILASTNNFVAAGNPSDPVWRSALAAGEPVSGETSLTSEAPEYVRAVPLSPRTGGEDAEDLDEEEAVAARARVVEAGQSYAFVQEALSAFTNALLVALGAAFLVSVAGAYLLARAALAPVGAVVSSAREIQATDLSRRLPVKNERDELGELTVTINGLLTRLEEAFARREATIEGQRRFASDASHELRTPLTSIAGYARMLREWGLEDRQTAGEGVDAIERESTRMRGLVESLLMLTRGDEGLKLELEEADLGREATEATEAARPAADRVSLDYEPPLSQVHARFDRAKVRQVISILLDNAIRYTRSGDSVTVRAFRRGGYAAVEVADTGPGIPEDQIPHLFERFYRAEPARSTEGTGLGLSIADQIASAHGGSIEVESTPGKGSTFTLLLADR